MSCSSIRTPTNVVVEGLIPLHLICDVLGSSLGPKTAYRDLSLSGFSQSLQANARMYVLCVCVCERERESRSQWPRGLRSRSAAAWLLGSWVRIPLKAWIFDSCVYILCSSVLVEASAME
jgi:hypothetical protein